MLAIIIPYYKLAFFEKTLQSLASQTDKRFKVYVGNDASPENPENLLKKFSDSFEIVYRKFDKNKGGVSLVSQWERCIAMAEHEKWITILGDDDVPEANFVAAFYHNLPEIENLNCNVIRYASVVIDQNDNKTSKVFQHPKTELPSGFLIRRIKGETRSSLSEYIFNKAALQKTGFKDLPLAWYSDVLAVFEFSADGFIFSINESTVAFRISGLNISSNDGYHKLKNEASFAFYLYLLKNKKACFDAAQTEILRLRLEKTFLDNKRNAYFWATFTKFHVSELYFKKYLLFLIKIVKSVT